MSPALIQVIVCHYWNKYCVLTLRSLNSANPNFTFYPYFSDLTRPSVPCKSNQLPELSPLTTRARRINNTPLSQVVADVSLQPHQMKDFHFFVHAQIRGFWTLACLDNGHSLGAFISPDTMAAIGITRKQLKLFPFLTVQPCAGRKELQILGQAPSVELIFERDQLKFWIRSLVLQGLEGQ